METPTYYELKSIEKDGLPKYIGHYNCFNGDAPKACYFIYGKFFINERSELVTHYLVPVSPPPLQKDKEEMTDEEVEKFIEWATKNKWRNTFLGDEEGWLNTEYPFPNKEPKGYLKTLQLLKAYRDRLKNKQE